MTKSRSGCISISSSDIPVFSKNEKCVYAHSYTLGHKNAKREPHLRNSRIRSILISTIDLHVIFKRKHMYLHTHMVTSAKREPAYDTFEVVSVEFRQRYRHFTKSGLCIQ